MIAASKEGKTSDEEALAATAAATSLALTTFHHPAECLRRVTAAPWPPASSGLEVGASSRSTRPDIFASRSSAADTRRGAGCE